MSPMNIIVLYPKVKALKKPQQFVREVKTCYAHAMLFYTGGDFGTRFLKVCVFASESSARDLVSTRVAYVITQSTNHGVRCNTFFSRCDISAAPFRI